jgi:hypothetical protein
VAPARIPQEAEALTPHGHTVLVALTLNDAPIDMLADRLGPTRGGLDRLHDAYSKLRARLARDRLALDSAPAGRTRVSHHDASRSADLLARLLGPAGEELTCEECFEQLDRYVELDLLVHEADVAVSGMRAHLEGCSACREDHDGLAALLEAESGLPPG